MVGPCHGTSGRSDGTRLPGDGSGRVVRRWAPRLRRQVGAGHWAASPDPAHSSSCPVSELLLPRSRQRGTGESHFAAGSVCTFPFASEAWRLFPCARAAAFRSCVNCLLGTVVPAAAFGPLRCILHTCRRSELLEKAALAGHSLARSPAGRSQPRIHDRASAPRLSAIAARASGHARSASPDSGLQAAWTFVSSSHAGLFPVAGSPSHRVTVTSARAPRPPSRLLTLSHLGTVRHLRDPWPERPRACWVSAAGSPLRALTAPLESQHPPPVLLAEYRAPHSLIMNDS